jgi:hypothetical protein
VLTFEPVIFASVAMMNKNPASFALAGFFFVYNKAAKFCQLL